MFDFPKNRLELDEEFQKTYAKKMAPIRGKGDQNVHHTKTVEV
jgi:hypothetical protein